LKWEAAFFFNLFSAQCMLLHACYHYNSDTAITITVITLSNCHETMSHNYVLVT
jgi:hypothetical protein